MPLHRNSSQKKNREAEKPQRVAAVRNALSTTTMAAAAAVSPDKPLTEKQKLYAVARARGESVPNAMAAANKGCAVSGICEKSHSNGLWLCNTPECKAEFALDGYGV